MVRFTLRGGTGFIRRSEILRGVSGGERLTLSWGQSLLLKASVPLGVLAGGHVWNVFSLLSHRRKHNLPNGHLWVFPRSWSLLPSSPYGTHGKGGSLWNCKVADPFRMPASSRRASTLTGKDPKGHLFQLLLCPQPARGLGGLPVVPAPSF